MAFRIYMALAILMLFISCNEQELPTQKVCALPFYGVQTSWADSVLNELSLDEKLNQLFVIEMSRFDSNLFEQNYGGCIIDSDLEDLIHLANQNLNKDIPLFVGAGSIDFPESLLSGELLPIGLFGLSEETFDSVLSLKQQLFNYLGVNFCMMDVPCNDSSYSPWADFSSRYVQKAISTMNSCRSNGQVMVAGSYRICEKDSMQTTSKEKEMNQMIEQLIDSGLISIGIERSCYPADPFVFRDSNYCKERFDRGGLLASLNTDEQDTVRCCSQFKWGADLFYAQSSDSACIKRFKKVVKEKLETNQIDISELDDRVRNILIAKTWMRKSNEPINKQEYLSQFHIPLRGVSEQIKKESLVLLKNENNSVPVRDINAIKTGLVSYRGAKFGQLYEELNKFEDVAYFKVSKGKFRAGRFKSFGKLVLLIQGKLDTTSAKDLEELSTLDDQLDLIIVNIGFSNNLEYLEDFTTVMQVYGEYSLGPQNLAEAIYGGIVIKGRLRKSHGVFKAGYGLTTNKTRLEYALPEEVGIHTDSLQKVRSVAREMIFTEAAPGCQIVAIKNGKIIYDRSFGHHTYDKIRPVRNTDVYDLASLTKILATTPAFMTFCDSKTFLLDDSLGIYLPDSLEKKLGKKSAFEGITFRELLEHKSGAASGLRLKKFYQYQNDSIGRWDKYYCDYQHPDFAIKISDNFYLDADYYDSLWYMLNAVKLDPEKQYKYSDINMNMIYKLMVGKVPKEQSYSMYLDSLFYRSLGLKTMCFNPLNKLDTNLIKIAPTEYDTYWRGAVLKGYVHDPTAALFGGEAGSAGLFSSAKDVGVFCQMILNGGEYGGKRYIRDTTIALFTCLQPDSERGLGFDKPTGDTSSTKAYDCPVSAYGHTGFTGTCVWVDPVNDFIFVFCSNRVYPDPLNNKINTLSIRARLHQIFYDQIFPIDQKE